MEFTDLGQHQIQQLINGENLGKNIRLVISYSHFAGSG
jgi:hypothetical protein